MKTCEACGKKVLKVFTQSFNNEDYLELCKECYDQYELNREMAFDMEYERQREEGII